MFAVGGNCLLETGGLTKGAVAVVVVLLTPHLPSTTSPVVGFDFINGKRVAVSAIELDPMPDSSR